MTRVHLVKRGLTYYWRTNVAVVLGVATAVAVLAGALLVGDSVRGSLRDLVLQRLGTTDRVVLSPGFFREALADDLRGDSTFVASFAAICPMIAVQGLVTDQTSGRRASRVQVYGVDDRFWRFHGRSGGERLRPEGGTSPRVPSESERGWGPASIGKSGSGGETRDALLSPALASDLGAKSGHVVLVRVERPSAIPIESLQGRKDNLGRTLRLTVRAILAPVDLGEFSLTPQQGQVRAVFVPLRQLQHDLDLAGRVNLLLVEDPLHSFPGSAGFGEPTGTPAQRLARNADLETLIRRHATLEDLGITVRVVGAEPRLGAAEAAPYVRPELAVESTSGVLDQPRAAAAAAAAADTAMKARPVLTYLANTLKSGAHEVPYSLVTAIDLGSIVSEPIDVVAAPPPIVLNDWTAHDLGAKVGDPLTLEYYVWEEPGRLVTRRADFRIAASVPIAGAAADRDLAPVYPGITEARSLHDWDPPFPIDLRRIRHADEDYWDSYRTTPKAFIPFEVGQALWRSRYGDRTSMRIVPAPGQPVADARDQYAARLRAMIDALSVRDVRAEGLAASRGATDFGEYFTYFSFFLVMSALMLAALFFRLGVEQRVREVGLLRAVGFSTAAVRRLFASEGLVLAAAGSVIGVAGAVGYGAMMMFGLRTWWSGAVGTPALSLHVRPVSLAAGAAGALAAAVVCIWWTLRGLARISERSLLAGKVAVDDLTPGIRSSRSFGTLAGAIGFGILGAALMAATIAGGLERTGAFFGAGTSLLAACLFLIAFRLRAPARVLLEGHGWWPVMRLGLRNAADRPGRSVLAIGVIASATFILISVGAFRRERPAATDRHSGVGGYSLLVDLMLPLAHDPGSSEGRDALGLTSDLKDATIEPFRVRPGDDASCLNLYEPTNPRILGATGTFIESGRFAFQRSLASSDAERANPWLLLNRSFGDDVAPVIADANSMTYVLHKALGEDVVVNRGGRSLRLRLVAALDDSIFQSELVMSDANFVKLFPEQEGYRMLLVETPPGRAAQVAGAIEAGAADLGADAASTVERLAEFHRVENTYLSTFQTLGGLGLLVGTIGLAAVLLRNVLERRRELALLGASGYRRSHIFVIVLAENALLLGWGLAVGAVCALVAIAPAVADRGGRVPIDAAGVLLLVAVLAAGLLSSVVATRAALRAPLLDSLRAE